MNPLYVTKFAYRGIGGYIVDSRMTHYTMAEVLEWATQNNMALGPASCLMPYFTIEHVDGSPLSEEETERVREVANYENLKKRRVSGVSEVLAQGHCIIVPRLEL